MYWRNARIILLAGALFQGVEVGSAKAQFHIERLGNMTLQELVVANTSRVVVKNSTKIEEIKKFLTANENSIKRSDLLNLPTRSSQVGVNNLRSLTLLEVEDLVKLNNPTLKAASLRIEQERSKLQASISAWYPTIDLTANGLPQYLMADSYSNPDYSSTPNTRSSQWKTQFTVKVKWNLIDPARVPQIAAARASFEKARDSYLITLRDIKLQSAIKFFELQHSDQKVLVNRKSLNSSLISNKDARARFDAGLASKFETLEAKTQLARDRRLLGNALRDQEIARRSLAELVNLPQNVIPVSAQVHRPIGLWNSSLEESIIAAYAFREELDRYLLDISINNSKANEALAAAQPSLSLVNTFDTSRTQGQLNVVEPSDKDYGWTVSNTIGLTATWKIFDGGNAKALYRLNKNKVKEHKANFVSERNKIRKQVEESYFSLNAASQALTSAKNEIIAQREVLRLARLRFNAGISNQREVLENQRDLRQSEINYADAISSYNTSLVQLRRHTGLDQIQSCDAFNLNNAQRNTNVVCEASLINEKAVAE